MFVVLCFGQLLADKYIPHGLDSFHRMTAMMRSFQDINGSELAKGRANRQVLLFSYGSSAWFPLSPGLCPVVVSWKLCFNMILVAVG